MEKEFVEMINNHRKIIYKVCHLYGHEKEYIEDLFQEIVLQLWKSFHTFRGEAQLTTWMYRVALNTAISSFRRESRKPKSTLLTEAEMQIPELNGFPYEDENVMLLKAAISHLSRIEKAVIMLYLEEKSYQEISAIMGITPSHVGVKINRIKIKLEKIIKEYHYELR